MYACIIRETFVFSVFRRVFHSILKLELCRHACRRRDQIIPTCRYGKNMPTTALVTTQFQNASFKFVWFCFIFTSFARKTWSFLADMLTSTHNKGIY